jgi:hypothetical protein
MAIASLLAREDIDYLLFGFPIYVVIAIVTREEQSEPVHQDRNELPFGAP